MTGEAYAELGEDIQAAIVALIDSVVNADTPNLSKVLDRDPVNFDETEWLGALRSDVDVDEHGEKRVHAWVVTFVASEELQTSQNRSIAPDFTFKIQFFYAHDFGTNADNSEKRMRAEVLKVQLAFAQKPKLMDRTRHNKFPIRLRLARFSAMVVHRGEGELVVENDAFNVY